MDNSQEDGYISLNDTHEYNEVRKWESSHIEVNPEQVTEVHNEIGIQQYTKVQP